ncbi:hypothetical protein J23TS9_54100 [Paenibacillus sp. J23TS9]|uniref:DUF3883 domain-containing protein n=1 Tax=Paenibacillus sp. J23TS9 TaxID=2807193 RepID=UPI001B1E21B9|nr:DUF3883 domain-containing protein [Paenibacillus sp. J23TS9]GIP30280.1 hypothetical protein J23TS9_54100 [Paenibacillus sp. J23TS9]
MLAELKNHNNLGNINEIKFVITEAISTYPKTLRDIERYCLSNTSYYNIPTKGIIALLDFISAISYCDEGVYLNTFGENFLAFESTSNLNSAIIRALLSKLILEEKYPDFIDLESISFDYFHEAYIIKNSEIPFKYAAIRNLLINLGFFIFSSNVKNLLVIDHNYSALLEEILKPAHRNLTVERFKKLQSLKEKYGQEAEEFVLKYEKSRLANHRFSNKILRISEIDVNAGYDIISFNSQNSSLLDRLIEVKSYAKEQGFYWSKNEVEVAKTKKSMYYLYLVDRDKMNEDGYSPSIIFNPYELVFESKDWTKEAQSWFFRKK